MLFFRADGTYDFIPGAVVEMPYRIESNEIVFPAATIDGREQRSKLQFTGQNQMKLLGDPGELLTREGVAPNLRMPILGEWKGKRDMGGRQTEVRYIFYPNGDCLLLIPFTSKAFKYTVESQNIRMELPNQKPLVGKLQIKNGVLTLPDPSGTGNTYSRY